MTNKSSVKPLTSIERTGPLNVRFILVVPSSTRSFQSDFYDFPRTKISMRKDVKRRKEEERRKIKYETNKRVKFPSISVQASTSPTSSPEYITRFP